MAERYIDLERSEPCPYCKTTVDAGRCSCPSCGAEHAAVYHGFLTPLAFLALGWWIGGAIYAPGRLAVAFILALLGSVAVKGYADRHPRWRRGSW